MAIRFLIFGTATIVACLQAGALLAQSAPAPGSTAAPAPAASSAAPAATTDKASPGHGVATAEPSKPKPKLRLQMSAQTRQELDHSLKTRTVPSRYRSQIPKEYQKYIPFGR